MGSLCCKTDSTCPCYYPSSYIISESYKRDHEEDNIKAFDEHGEPLFLDDEVREIVDSLRTRPEMKILFSASKKATKEDIMKTVKIIEALRNGEDE